MLANTDDISFSEKNVVHDVIKSHMTVYFRIVSWRSMILV